MKIRFKKLFLISTLATTASLGGVAFAVSNIANYKNNSLILNSSINNINQRSMINVGENIKSNIKQYYTTNNSGNSYAIVTQDNNNNKQIKRFDLKGSQQGKSVWTKNLDDLKVDGSRSFTATNIKAIIYTSSGLNSNGYLNVLASNSNSTYLFSLNWNDGNVESSIKVSDDTDPNMLVVIDSFNNSIVAMSNKDINDLSKDYEIEYYFISKNTKSNPPKKTISISKDLLALNFNTDMFASDIISKNGSTYVLYQSEKISSITGFKTHSIIKFQFSNSGEITNRITQNYISSYSLSTTDIETFGNDKKISAKLINMDDSKEFSVVLTADGKELESNRQPILISWFNSDNISFSNTIHTNYPVEQDVSNKKYLSKNILQIRPYYNGDNGEQSGFIALDSGNKVVLLNNWLEPESILKSFGTANTVYHMSTIRGIADWFPQDQDEKIADFFGGTLIGDLESISNSSITESLVDFSFKTNHELSLSTKFMKAIDTSGSSVSSELRTFISKEDAYLDFLNIESYDVRFPEPIITIKADSPNGTDKSVELEFTQQLRKRESNGEFSKLQDHVLGKFKYKFINNNAQISKVDKKDVPNTILNKLPSEITSSDVEKYLLKSNNVDGAIYTMNPDDKNGILSITATYPYIWENNVLKTNLTKDFVFGTQSEAFFKIDRLVGYNTSITPITSEYLNSDDNKDKAKTLGIKYSVTLPSELSSKQYLEDFVELGSAFSNATLINTGEIIPPAEKDIIVTPIDTEGVALIDLTIPKVGDKENIKLSFVTANVFKKNPFANSNFYFMFEDNDTVLKKVWDISNPENTLAKYSASILANTLNDNKNILKEKLDLFADFSPYIGNLIALNNDLITVQAIGNDLAGTLEIKVLFKEGIEGFDGKEFKEVFVGFKSEQKDITQSASKFSFNEWSNSLLLTNAPSLIKEDDVRSLFEYHGSSSQTLAKEVKLNPINTFGTLEVIVTFKGWIEQDGLEKKIIPEKKFSRTYTGFARTKDPMDMLVFKSFYELDPLWQSGLTASQVINLINNESKINQLKKFCNISNSLNDYLIANEGNLEVDITFDDTKGSISIITSVVKENGETSVASSTISGFAIDKTNIAIIMTRNDSEAIEKLKLKSPSELDEKDISQLYNISSGNSFRKEIVTNFDDLNGTLTLTVRLVDNYGGLITESFATYSGFKTNIPEYQATNWLALTASIAIPLVVLLIPILFIKFYLDRRDMNAISTKLDKRLTDETKKKRNKNIRTIKDLLND